MPKRGFSQTNQAGHLAKATQSWQILVGTTLGLLPSLHPPQGSQVKILNRKLYPSSHTPSQNIDAFPTIHNETPTSWPSKSPHATHCPSGQRYAFLTSSLAFGIPYLSPPQGAPAPFLPHTHNLPATTSAPPLHKPQVTLFCTLCFSPSCFGATSLHVEVQGDLPAALGSPRSLLQP